MLTGVASQDRVLLAINDDQRRSLPELEPPEVASNGHKPPDNKTGPGAGHRKGPSKSRSGGKRKGGSGRGKSRGKSG